MDKQNTNNNSAEISLNNLATAKKQKINFFYLCVWIFTLSCFFGFAVEVLYAFIKTHEYHNKQGMIYGPFNQIYGFGAVIFTVLLYKLRNAKKYILFIIGMFLGGVFEYLCSLIQELVFKSYSWNYSKFSFSIGGRTSLFHCLCWGILSVCFFSFCLPLMIKLADKFRFRAVKILSLLIFAFMIFNLSISSLAVIRQNQRREGIAPENAVEVFIDKHYSDEYFKKVYPDMKFKD